MKGKSNPVAKHLRTFNKATVERDRKKDSKKGVSKYKKDIYKEEGDLEKARDNVGSDSCWDGYKATGTKKKGGKLVPDCKKESIGESTDKLISSYVRGDINIKTVRRGTSMSSPIFVKVTDGKKTHEMGPYKSAAQAKTAVNKMHPAPKGKRTMESIDEGLSDAQIETLRKQYATLKTVNPTGAAWKKVTKFLEARTAKELEGIALAKIKFISQTASDMLKRKHGVKLKFSDTFAESVEFNEAYIDLLEAVPPINMLMPGLIDGSKTYQQAGKEIVKDAWRALTGKQKRVVAKVHKLTQSDDELGKLYRDGWKSGGTSMKPGARKAFDARVKELMPNEESRDYIAAWKSVKAKVQSAMKDQRNESVEQVDEKVVPYNKELLARMIELVQMYFSPGNYEYTDDDYKKAMSVIKKIAGPKVAAEVSSKKATDKVHFGRANKVSGHDIMRDRQGLSGRKKTKSGKLSKVSMSQFKKDVEDAMSKHQKVTRKLPESIEQVEEAYPSAVGKSRERMRKHVNAAKRTAHKAAVDSMMQAKAGLKLAIKDADDESREVYSKEVIRLQKLVADHAKVVRDIKEDVEQVDESSKMYWPKRDTILRINKQNKDRKAQAFAEKDPEILDDAVRDINRYLKKSKGNPKTLSAYDTKFYQSSIGKIERISGKTAAKKQVAQIKKKYKGVKESVDHLTESGISVEQFDRLKSKQKVTIDFSSVMGGSGSKEFIVTRKSKLKGGKVEKITLKSVKNPVAQASYLYKRDGKSVSMAQGDMAVNAKSLKEGMRVETYNINALMEKAIEIQYTDKPDFGEDQALSYGRKEGYKEVGVIGTSARTAMVIFKLNAFDKKYTKGVRLGAGEEIFRYTSRGTTAGGIMPLIKVNMKRGLAYYLTQESSAGEIEEPVFETKAQKLKFIRLLTSAYKPGHIVKENVEQIDEGSTKKIGKEIEDYAHKQKRIDPEEKANILKVAAMMKKGDSKGAIKYVKNYAFDVPDWVVAKVNPTQLEQVEQIDEIVAKLNKNGEIEMTKKKYAKVHKDFKGKWPDGEHYVTQHMGKQGMTQVPVKFVREDVEQFDENDIKATPPKAKPTKVGQKAKTSSHIGSKYPDNKWVVKKNTGTSKAYRPLEWVLESIEEKMDRETKRDVKTLIRLGDKPRLAIKTAKDNMSKGRSRLYTPKKQRAEYRKAYESVEQVDELTQREKEMIADRKAKRMTKSGRTDKKTRLLPKTTTYVRPSKGEDDHIVMQLRRAQDSANFGNGEFDIRVSPVKGAEGVRLKKPQIDKLLNVYDKLDKPEQKRKYRITLLKTLRSMQQKGK